MIKNLTLILILFFCNSCHRNGKYEAGIKAIAEFSRKMNQEKKWVLEGYGGGFLNDNFRLTIAFCVYDQLYTLPETREILVNTMEDFLIYLNNNKKIREYISHFPLTHKDIELSISFRDSKKIFIPKQFISYAFVINGDTFYSIWEYHEYRHKLKTIHGEVYQDSLHVVKIDPGYEPKPLRLTFPNKT